MVNVHDIEGTALCFTLIERGEAKAEWWYTDSEDAVRICHDCEIMDACRAQAHRDREPFFTWGGETAKERSRFVQPEGHKPGSTGYLKGCRCNGCVAGAQRRWDRVNAYKKRTGYNEKRRATKSEARDA